jgi:multidrug efflux system outer membrane protein
MQFFILALLLFASCRVGPVYQPPQPSTPAEWKAPFIETEQTAEIENWWDLFEDDRLNDLESQAIVNNPQLQLALERVLEARATAGIARSDLFPQLNLNPSYSNTETLFKLYGVPAGIIPGLKQIIRVHEFVYALPATLSYELDLWGKNRSLYQSALYNAQAQEAAYGVALLSLTADLASFYYNLQTLDAQIEVLQKTVLLRQRSLKLNRSRYGSGISGGIDVSSAELELSNTEAELEDTKRQRTLFENAIATLIGIPASDFCLEKRPLSGEPPLVPAGLPSTMLFQRPDIAEAERGMASEHAQINVAYASFFPAISLTGTLGYLSPDLKQFMTWKSRYWSYGANGSQFLFDAGKRCSEVEVAWARFHQAEASYQQTVLTAFQEVEDALNNLDWEKKQHESLLRSVRAASQTLHYSNRRFTNGIVDYYEVIDSERSDLNAQLSAINVQGQRFQATIQLIKALGGGWITSGCEN